MIETIICTAVWYKDLESKMVEMPISAYLPKNIDKGIVFCGFRHGHCIYTACVMTGLKQHESGENIQGFLTNKNRFVDRKEAAQIALAANQIKDMNRFNQNKLFSEDIY